MRRLVGEYSTYISKSKLARLMGDGFGQVIIEKIGDEHDGRQVVLRFTVHRQAKQHVELSVKEYVWDHGGCMIGEEGKGVSSDGGTADGI